MGTYHYILFGLALILFAILTYRYIYKLQLMTNREYLSLYLPDSENLPIDFWRVVELGREKCKNSTVVICTLLRDIEDISDINMINHIRKKVEAVGELFHDYRVLIVENDSSDTTRDLLLTWSEENSKVTILGCGYNAYECSMKYPKTEGRSTPRWRIEKMAYLRNIYLDEVKTTYGDSDFTIVWDLDSISTVYLEGILHSIGLFGTHKNLDAICANGIYRVGSVPIYYDGFAHVGKCENFDQLCKYPRLQFLTAKIGDTPVSVVSCFGGFTIYRTRSISDREYSAKENGDTIESEFKSNVPCEHTSLVKGKNMVVNPSMINLIIKNP